VCPTGRAGIRKAWFIDASEVTDITFDAVGNVDTITVALLGGFTAVEFEKDTAFVEQAATRNGYNVNTAQTLSMVFPIMNGDLRNRLRSLFDCACGVIALVRDNLGSIMVLGIDTFENGDWVLEGAWDYVQMNTGEGSGNTGADPAADRNEYVVTLMGNTNFFAPFTTFGEAGIPVPE